MPGEVSVKIAQLLRLCFECSLGFFILRLIEDAAPAQGERGNEFLQ